MKANACYLCTRPFGMIRHRHSNKQFCSKKCLDEWRAGVARALQESNQQQSVKDVYGTGSPGLVEGARFPQGPSRRG
jgi:hypothetical protein